MEHVLSLAADIYKMDIIGKIKEVFKPKVTHFDQEALEAVYLDFVGMTCTEF